MSVILNSGEISRALRRISHEILEKNHGPENLLLLGIPTRGAYLSRRIAGAISEIEKINLESGTLDITMYRDDLRLKAPRTLLPTSIPGGSIDGRDVVLIDDVFFSGRTIRAALDALNELGRPKSVQLAVLIDRGHRELPIRADFVGKNIPTAKEESVRVHLSEIDSIDEVLIEGSSQ
ncbi:MAG: bifunctional pyr operon transcriptional regulator/uracil phosphoribosyltransferase PyrR [Candidatus Nanopelagicaceae bacterium]|jgi:pyrimidine operon attenuation protein / uracil phosphoribosyltransferase|nr:bifunctional pyr operon transcriptional regulator/uracil phosphoribosyltransferase PyrR [Candidatus Nanopelagicaceae bacterium]